MHTVLDPESNLRKHLRQLRALVGWAVGTLTLFLPLTLVLLAVWWIGGSWLWAPTPENVFTFAVVAALALFAIAALVRVKVTKRVSRLEYRSQGERVLTAEDLRRWRILEESDRRNRANHRAIREDVENSEENPPAPSTAVCSVYGPHTVGRHDGLLISVFVYNTSRGESVAKQALATDPDAVERGARVLGLALYEGDQLSISLEVSHALVEEPDRTVSWQGQIVQEIFVVRLNPGAPRWVVGKALVCRNGVPLGRVTFRLGVSDEIASYAVTAPLNIGVAHTFARAFLSYASPDRAEVLRRAQMLEAMKISFFQDIMSLDPGDRWERKLYQEIDKADVFFLFWSSSAAKSQWVLKELEYAQRLTRNSLRNLPELVPVVIEGPPPPAPPPGFADRNFNSKVQYFIAAHSAAEATTQQDAN
jgi:hypothetical protein